MSASRSIARRGSKVTRICACTNGSEAIVGRNSSRDVQRVGRSSSQGPAPCDGDGYLLRGTEEYRPRIRSHGPGEARHDCYDVSWRTEYRMCGCIQRVRDESCCTEHARGARRAGCLWGCGCGRLPGRLKTRLRDVAASHFRIETSYRSGHASPVLAPSVRPRPRQAFEDFAASFSLPS